MFMSHICVFMMTLWTKMLLFECNLVCEDLTVL